jgi:cytochrome P450
MRRYPDNMHVQIWAHTLAQEYDLPAIYCLDLYPFSSPIMMIRDTGVAQHVTVAHSLPKHDSLVSVMKPLAGPYNLISLDGPVWKRWRANFNPGFASKQLYAMVPEMVDQTAIFVDALLEYARKDEVFRLEYLATKLTFDIIGKVTL